MHLATQCAFVAARETGWWNLDVKEVSFQAPHPFAGDGRRDIEATTVLRVRDAGREMSGVLAPGLLGHADKTFELFEKYRTSGPYPHCFINPICDLKFMKEVHRELTENMKANFKETDLFKVFQTDELGTLDAKAMKKTMPHLLKLRTALYSKEFRQFVQNVTGCGELTDRVDCSSNAYANSCHLLCHDDVIGTRRISYIIYLSDPDEEWHEEDGGAVELYPIDSKSAVFHNSAGPQGIPTAAPTAKIIPQFNSVLFFTVLPGRSYHSVQEVFAKDRPRLSISGWYHGAEPPVGADKSSLRLIMSSGDLIPSAITEGEEVTKEDGSFRSIPSKVLKNDLSEKDISFLSKFISSEYLSAEGIANIAEQFCQESSVQLSSFLTEDWAAKIFSKIVVLDDSDKLGKCRPSLDHSIGIGAGWELRGPSHKRRYLAFNPSAADDAKSDSTELQLGRLLEELLQRLFCSEAFARYLKALTTCIITAQRAELRRFRAGFDYTVAHYGCLTKEPRLDATLCFVNDDREAEGRVLQRGDGQKDKKKKKNNKGISVPCAPSEDDGYDSDYAGVWEDGEVGAFECYIEADQDADDAEAAEVYKLDYSSKPAATKPTKQPAKRSSDEEDEDEDEEEEEEGGDAEKALLSVSARHNSLSLVLRDEGLMKFIKYTSANAPGSRYDISLEYVTAEA